MDKNIVLVHGWGANVKKLKFLETALENLGWNTFLIKLPGFDLDPPIKPWELKNYANYVSKASEKQFKDKKYFIFGHSFGGRVAIKMSADEKIEGHLKGVVLCSAGGVSRGSFIKRKLFYILAKVGKIFLVFPPAANIFKKFIYKLAGEHDYEKTKGVMRKTFVNIVEEELKDKLKLIKIPTLLLWGKNDKITPIKDAYLLDKNIADSKLIIYENQGHRLPYIEYKKLARSIDNWVNNINF